MWIFTDTGFISIVRNPGLFPDKLHVRSRDRHSLVSLSEATGQEIRRSPHGDYTYRVYVTVEQFNEWMFARTAELEYKNFKNQVAKTRGSNFAYLLHDVWSVMLGAQDAAARTPVLDGRGNELAYTGGPMMPLRERKTNFGHTVEDIAEDDPRIVAYYWEGYEVGTENPTWGHVEAADKDDMRFGLLGQVEEITFYGLRTMPAELLKEVE